MKALCILLLTVSLSVRAQIVPHLSTKDTVALGPYRLGCFGENGTSVYITNVFKSSDGIGFIVSSTNKHPPMLQLFSDKHMFLARLFDNNSNSVPVADLATDEINIPIDIDGAIRRGAWRKYNLFGPPPPHSAAYLSFEKGYFRIHEQIWERAQRFWPYTFFPNRFFVFTNDKPYTLFLQIRAALSTPTNHFEIITSEPIHLRIYP